MGADHNTSLRIPVELLERVDELTALFTYVGDGGRVWTRSDVVRRALVELVDRHAGDVERYRQARDEFRAD